MTKKKHVLTTSPTLSEDIQPSERHGEPLKILVGWSPNTTGSEAIHTAAWLARTVGTVEIQCVTVLLRPWPSPAISKLGEKYRKWFKKEASRLEKVVHEELTREGILDSQLSKRFSVLADGTNEAALIAKVADDFDADLILLGSSATASKGRLLASSTADALLHHSVRPLGLAPRAPKLSKRGVTRINYAYIGEDGEEETLLQAADTAAEWDVPLRIVALSPSGFGEAPVTQSLELPKDIELEWREQTFAILDRFNDRIHTEHPNLVTETEIGSGKGWQGALEALKWKKGDLLILRSTPLGTLERVFGGSHITELLPYLRVPVIMLPATETP